ncbi:hypothetical protein SKAU_G00177860 [Synaphobranchus kaupii]|uniref:Reverse transcriptase n=1 Tax=Synaphobranchus kaupii TaxID=118154 RepID=A0A9Q1J0G1_SYNKA|nr:hypothetical protein SKAU_G00177860 [Synaphobranchus kaupii]
MNTKEAFQKVKTLTGYDSKPMPSAITDPLSFAEDLNIFYARFDTTNCSEECKALLETLPIPEPAHPAPFTVEDVRRQLSRCKPGKAPGPDGIQARVLKECAAELAPIMHSLFWESYKTASVPILWKTSSIIPVPKKPHLTVAVPRPQLLIYKIREGRRSAAYKESSRGDQQGDPRATLSPANTCPAAPEGRIARCVETLNPRQSPLQAPEFRGAFAKPEQQRIIRRSGQRFVGIVRSVPDCGSGGEPAGQLPPFLSLLCDLCMSTAPACYPTPGPPGPPTRPGLIRWTDNFPDLVPAPRVG